MGDMVLSTAAEEMSVVDVYDLASDIGKECEKIIEIFGPDSVTGLMPKVIGVLELLEAMASRNECENTKMQELNDRIAYLESEKQERAVFRERYQKVPIIFLIFYLPRSLNYLTNPQSIMGTIN